MEVLRSEDIYERTRKLFSEARRSLKICSPWVKGEVFEELIYLVRTDVKVEIILRASSLEDLKITDPRFFEITREWGVKVYLHPKLHAKFVVKDGEEAIVGSANITHQGLLPPGNIETAVFIRNRKEVSRLSKEFETIKEESFDLSKAVAFVVDMDSPRQGKLVLLRELQDQTYIKIPSERGNFFLGRVFDIRSLNPTLQSIGDERVGDDHVLRDIFSEESEDWKVATLFARSQEGFEVKVAKFEVLGEYEGERNLFKTPVKPVKAGSPVEVLKAEEEELKAILLKNHSGYDMKFPTYLGKLRGTEVSGYLDMDKVISMHMAVIGTTGSGKTTFVKKVIRNFQHPARVFIIDMYGEYYETLKGSISTKRVSIPNVLLPVDGEDLKRLFREVGLSLSERSSEERELASFFRKHLKPELTRTSLSRKSLETLIKEASLHVKDRVLREALSEALELWKALYGEDSVKEQPSTVEAIRKSLKAKEKVVVIDLKDVDISQSRVNVAGLLMRELLKLSKKEPIDRIVVLEEAHNFAPERGTGEVQSGRENLAYMSAKRIAMEGRKLRLGLIAITQRPANLSKFILSQLNTQVIFKLITRNDLEAVSPFFESSKEDVFRLLPFLKPGTAYITGLAVPFSFLFQMEEIPYW